MNNYLCPVICLSLLLTAGGCMEDSMPDKPVDPASETMNNNGKRTLEDALQIAEQWFAAVDPETRAGQRKVGSVEFLTYDSPTRSGGI